MSKVNYKKISLYYLIGTIFNSAISFLTVPIFTRILTTSDYGVVSTFNATAAILSMVIGLALHASIRVAYLDFEKDFNGYVSSMVSLTLLFGLIFSVCALIFAHVFFTEVSPLLVWLCLAYSLSYAILQDYSYYLMMQYKFRLRTVFMICPNLISVILSILAILFFFHNNLYLGRIAPTAVVFTLFGLLAAIIMLSSGKTFINKKYIQYGLAFSVPLIAHGIALNFLSQSDRIMITWLANAAETGIYSLVYNYGTIAIAITTALEGVWSPWFLRKIKEKEISLINERAKLYTFVITIVIIILILVSPEIIKLLADSPYWGGISIAPAIIVSSFIVFIYTFYVYIEHYYKKTVYLTVNTVISAIVNIGLNYLLIPHFGYIAAAYTTLASYILSLFLHARYAKTIEPGLFPLRSFFIPSCSIVATCAAYYCLIDTPFARWGIAIGILIFGLFLKRKELVNLSKKPAKEIAK